VRILLVGDRYGKKYILEPRVERLAYI
jgi:hypothetical protein